MFAANCHKTWRTVVLKKWFLSQNKKVLEILLFRCHKGHQVSDHTPSQGVTPPSWTTSCLPCSLITFQTCGKSYRVSASAAESPVSRPVWLDSRLKKKKKLQQTSSWSRSRLFSRVKGLNTTGCGWLVTEGLASYLAHWDGESLDYLLVSHGNDTLTVYLDDPVSDTHAASLGDAASHQAANLRSEMAKTLILLQSCRL